MRNFPSSSRLGKLCYLLYLGRMRVLFIYHDELIWNSFKSVWAHRVLVVRPGGSCSKPAARGGGRGTLLRGHDALPCGRAAARRRRRARCRERVRRRHSPRLLLHLPAGRCCMHRLLRGAPAAIWQGGAAFRFGMPHAHASAHRPHAICPRDLTREPRESAPWHLAVTPCAHPPFLFQTGAPRSPLPRSRGTRGDVLRHGLRLPHQATPQAAACD